MIVRCSACKTRYLVDPAALGEAGRRVRCTNCGHVWHQTPEADAPEASQAADTTAPTAPLNRPPAWAGWAAAGLFVVAALAGLALARNAVVVSWPGTVSIYDAVGLPIQAPQAQGLRIVGVESDWVQEGERTVLLVRGAVENTTEKGRRLPSLQAVLADEAGATLLQWPVAALALVLDGGQSTPFESWLEDPPEGAVKLSVDFVADDDS